MSVKAILHPTDQLVAELNDRGSVNARAVKWLSNARAVNARNVK